MDDRYHSEDLTLQQIENLLSYTLRPRGYDFVVVPKKPLAPAEKSSSELYK